VLIDQLIIGKGGRVCLSDDSHGVTYVGLNYIKMRDYLLSVGVIEIYHLVGATERRKDDRVVGMRGRVLARRIGEEWAEDAFWRTLPVKQVPS
jgi:histidinol-phosphatase (PHP family)